MGAIFKLKRSISLPVELTVILALHFVFALYRLFIVISHLTPFLPRSRYYSSSSAPSSNNIINSLRRDQSNSRWSKKAKHIAIVFVPSLKLNFISRYYNNFGSRGKSVEGELPQLDKLMKDVKALLGWCESLGVESLSVYDEEGILERNAELVKSTLNPLLAETQTKSLGRSSFRVRAGNAIVGGDTEMKERGREIDSGCGASVEAELRSEPDLTISNAMTLVSPSMVDESTAATSKQVPLTINLLSRLSGRPHLAAVTRDIATLVGKGRLKSSTVDAGFIQESVEASGINDPDLLIVLGGPYLRLRGFPPWQLRLTEMYHHSSPSWLPPPPVTYPILRSALDVYGGAEMRLGR